MPKRQTQRIIDSRRRNSSATIIGATGSGVPVSLTAGDGLALTGTTIDVVAGDGVSVAADSVAVDSTVVRTTRTVTAGSGLTGGGALSSNLTLNVGAGTLITVGADTVGITTGANYQYIGTGSDTVPEWRNVNELAGNGLTATNGVLAVGVSGLGLGVGADAVTLASSSNPGAAASILASDGSGYLSLVRLTATDRLRAPVIDTATGGLTLDPAADVVTLAASTAIQTAHYASQLTGWRATYAGEADFRYLFVDEMHAKSFIADLEQALAGGQIICKSVAVLGVDFTAPAAGGTATLYVRDLPSAPNMACFVSGDIVRLRTFSRSGGSLSIADCWGVATDYVDGNGVNFLDGYQLWTFTRSAAPNAGTMTAGTVVAADALVLDYGTSGNGFYEVNAIDGAYGQNSPYARIATWTGHPATGTALRAQFGNLRGVYGYAATEFGVAMGSATGANVTVEATNGVRLRQGTTDMIVLDPAGDSYFAGVMTIGATGEIRQGTGTPGSNFTGLRLWRDANVGRIGGYNANTLQWYGDTSGNFVAGAGYVLLNANGIRQTVANVKSAIAEPSAAAIVPSVGQRLSFYDSADSADWGYTYPGGTDYDYFYPGMEWLRLYVSSQHFVQPQPYTTTITENYHVYDAVIEMPANTFTTNAGVIQRRRMVLKAPSILLDSTDVSIGPITGQLFRDVTTSSYSDGITLRTAGALATSTDSDSMLMFHLANNEMAIGVADGTAWRTLVLQPYGGVVDVRANNLLAGGVGYDWSNVTPATGFQNFGGSFPSLGVKRFGNLVSIKGLLLTTTTITADTTIYTLASEYRPTTTRIFEQLSSAGIVRVDVRSDGSIALQTALASGAWLSLERTFFTGG